MFFIHLESGGVTVSGVGFRGNEGGGGTGLLDRGLATGGGGVVEFASLLELVGGGDDAVVEDGVVEAGIRAEEARKECGIVDRAPMDTADPVEGNGAPKGRGGGGGGCWPESAAAVAACR